MAVAGGVMAFANAQKEISAVCSDLVKFFGRHNPNLFFILYSWYYSTEIRHCQEIFTKNIGHPKKDGRCSK
jgi:hypothetical protein